MTKYINNGQLNVEYLTKVWRQDFAKHYSDKPRLYLVLTCSPLTFKVDDDRIQIIFPVANEAHKQWLEIKMISEMIELFKSITGIQNLSIFPYVNKSDTENYTPPPVPPKLSKEKILVMDFVKDLELEPKLQYAERDIK